MKHLSKKKIWQLKELSGKMMVENNLEERISGCTNKNLLQQSI